MMYNIYARRINGKCAAFVYVDRRVVAMVRGRTLKSVIRRAAIRAEGYGLVPDDAGEWME